MIVPEPFLSIIEEPHALIAGCTGSGKSTLIDGVLWYLDKLNRAYCIIDLKMVSLLSFEEHALRYEITPENALKLMNDYCKEMEIRLAEMRQKRQALSDKPPLYLVVDECADLFDTVKESKPLIKHIARLGRAAKCHTILATQSPNRRTLSADIVLNYNCRVGLRCENAIESRQIINRPGCELLPRYGQGILKTPKGIGLVEIPKIV